MTNNPSVEPLTQWPGFSTGSMSDLGLITMVWISDSPFSMQFPRLYRIAILKHAYISEIIFFSPSGISCNLNFSRALRTLELDQYSLLTNAIKRFHFFLYLPNRYSWSLDPLGSFSIKSLFRFLTQSHDVTSFPSDLVWKGSAPLRVQTSIWIVTLNRMNTMDLLQRRWPYIALSPSICVLCGADEETDNHIMIHCNFSRRI